MLKGYLRTIYQNVGGFLRERYGPSPEFDRFFGQWTSDRWVGYR